MCGSKNSEILQVVFGILFDITALIICKVIHNACKCSVPTWSLEPVFWNSHDMEEYWNCSYLYQQKAPNFRFYNLQLNRVTDRIPLRV